MSDVPGMCDKWTRPCVGYMTLVSFSYYTGCVLYIRCVTSEILADELFFVTFWSHSDF